MVWILMIFSLFKSPEVTFVPGTFPDEASCRKAASYAMGAFKGTNWENVMGFTCIPQPSPPVCGKSGERLRLEN